MKLEFDELQKRCELNDDESQLAWRHSTGFHGVDTPKRPFSAYKRKNSDESNETFVVKRSKIDNPHNEDKENGHNNETTFVNGTADGNMNGVKYRNSNDATENNVVDVVLGMVPLQMKLQ